MRIIMAIYCGMEHPPTNDILDLHIKEEGAPPGQCPGVPGSIYTYAHRRAGDFHYSIPDQILGF